MPDEFFKNTCNRNKWPEQDFAKRQFADTHDVAALGRSLDEGRSTTIVDIGDGIDDVQPTLESVDIVLHMAAPRGDVLAKTHNRADVPGVYDAGFAIPTPRSVNTVDSPIPPRNLFSVSRMFTENLA